MEWPSRVSFLTFEICIYLLRNDRQGVHGS
jgi:hypothetical protein